ncbi:MAG: carbohydrate ABC transporter permease [Anaerolineales bacterium]|jgi:ABC-type glycerol-3-phosphate transport system permease component
MTENTLQPVQTQRKPFSRRKFLEKVGLVVLQIVMTVWVISFLVPTIWMISSSIKASTEVFAHPIVWIPEQPEWGNYAKVFELLPFGRFTINTIIVTGLAVLGTLVSSMLVAYSFARLRWPGKNIFFGILIATMMLPDVITLVPRFIMFRSFGWIDTFLPLIVPYWTGITALYVFLAVQFLRGLPVELEEAALIDGANRLQIIIRIILPLSKPVLATIAVFALLQHYNDFMQPLIYLSSLENWTLALGVRGLNSSYASNWEVIFAASTMMLAPVFLLFVFAQRFFVQGIAMTGFGGR